jgi:hypothetical protein
VADPNFHRPLGPDEVLLAKLPAGAGLALVADVLAALADVAERHGLVDAVFLADGSGRVVARRLPDASGGPTCRYCGADCSVGRSWDGGGLYACPPCAYARARVRLEDYNNQRDQLLARAQAPLEEVVDRPEGEG